MLSWQKKTIQECVDFTKKPHDLKIGKIPYIPFVPMEMIPIGGGEIVNYEKRTTIGSGTYVEDGDLLLAKITPSFENGKQGILHISHPFSYATTEVIPMKGKKEVALTDYIGFLLLDSDLRSDLADKMEGSTGRQRLSKAVLGNTLLPIPPLPEQHKIAYILSTIQAAIEKQVQIIQTTTELKKALMQKLFTEGFRGEKQKQSEIGLVPESWEVVKLAELIEKTELRNPTDKPNEMFIYIDVSSVSNTMFMITAPSTIKGGDAPSRARKVVRRGDVIFATVRPTLKRVSHIGDAYHNAVCSTGYCVLRANKDLLDANFLFQYLLTDNFIGRIEKRQRGASYPAVRDSDVKGLLFPKPVLAEQKEIAQSLSLCDLKIYRADRKKLILNDLFQSMLNQLMTAQIRVDQIEF